MGVCVMNHINHTHKSALHVNRSCWCMSGKKIKNGGPWNRVPLTPPTHTHTHTHTSHSVSCFNDLPLKEVINSAVGSLWLTIPQQTCTVFTLSVSGQGFKATSIRLLKHWIHRNYSSQSAVLPGKGIDL